MRGPTEDDGSDDDDDDDDDDDGDDDDDHDHHHHHHHHVSCQDLTSSLDSSFHCENFCSVSDITQFSPLL